MPERFLDSWGLKNKDERRGRGGISSDEFSGSMSRYWIFNPIPWIQTDKGRLKTDKIPPHFCPLPVKPGRG